MSLSFKLNNGKIISGNDNLDFVYNIVKYVYGENKKIFLEKLKSLERFQIKRLDRFENLKLKIIPVKITGFLTEPMNDYRDKFIEDFGLFGILDFSDYENIQINNYDDCLNIDIFKYLNTPVDKNVYDTLYKNGNLSFLNRRFDNALEIFGYFVDKSKTFRIVKGMTSLLDYHKSLIKKIPHYKIPKTYDELQKIIKRSFNIGYLKGYNTGYDKCDEDSNYN